MTDAGETPQEELDRLSTEVEDLRGRLDDRAGRAGRRLRWRKRLVGALVVLTSIAVFASTVGVWLHRQVYDTDAWIATIEDLPSDPDVASAIAAGLSTEIVDVADVDARVRDALPDEAQVLAGPIATGVEQLLDEVLVRAIQSDQFQTVWIEINRLAHDGLVAVLDGDGNLDVKDGKVQLDLVPLISQALADVAGEASGLLGDGEVPDITADVSSDKARDALSDYFGVDVPADFGQITVFQSSELAAVQDAAAMFTRLVWLLVIVTVGLIAATLGLSKDRRRTVVQLGVGAVVAIAVAWIAGRLIRGAVLDGIENDGNRAAASAAIRQVTSGLRATSQFVLYAGAFAAVVAFLTGDGSGARWVRTQARGLAGGAAAAASGTERGSEMARWVAVHVSGLRAAGLLVALGLSLLINLTWPRFLVIVVLLIAYELLVSAMARTGGNRGTAETPAETPAEAESG